MNDNLEISIFYLLVFIDTLTGFSRRFSITATMTPSNTSTITTTSSIITTTATSAATDFVFMKLAFSDQNLL